MTANWIRFLVFAGLALMAVQPGATGELFADIASCRAVKDDAKRLACYDSAVEMQTQQPHAAAAPPDAAPRSPEEQFGYRGALAREEQDRAKEETRVLGTLEAIVTELSGRADGTLKITLDNGQVWAQNRPDSFFSLKIGEQIKIEPAALGSFMMVSSRKRTSRVTRLK
jgi:hypothetical protein